MHTARVSVNSVTSHGLYDGYNDDQELISSCDDLTLRIRDEMVAVL